MLTENGRRFLGFVRFGELATINRDGTPQQSVMWYMLRGDEIVMNTARGRLKERNLRRDPRLSLCVSDGYSYVTITGRARLIDDPAIAQADIAALARRYHNAEAAERAIVDFQKQDRISIIVPIERAIERGV
jgi:PPOX class probable F420-dependent enzyme